MRVEPFAGAPAEWDAVARAQRGWTHFHLFGWKAVMERALGHECLYLAARDEAGALAGVLPLVRVRSVLFGHYLVSMPFLNYGGPLGSVDAVRALAAHAVERARAEGVKLLELRSRVPLPLDLAVSHRKITVVLDLPEGGEPERLWKQLDAKVRSQVRRPQKEGVTVRFGADQVAPFFSVLARHMRDLGTPTQGRALFDAIAAAFPEDAWFGCAYLGDEPVAGGAGFVWDGEFEMTWASALREHSRIAPNMLLYWSFMERAVRAGLRAFNFGRCTPGAGTHRFKRQWGSRDETLWWYGAGAAAAKTPSPDDGAWSWGPRLWRRLPEPVATALGPRIVRFIP
ncbi:MAG TPA: FemAB family XrtA/PEP-CTERM system-associated protein [Gemmatimonadaceae bacterium]|nr:FemAB family XrtA/PEP-CTERM system-associated protein [Gemmatimonadaceae bacterium]